MIAPVVKEREHDSSAHGLQVGHVEVLPGPPPCGRPTEGCLQGEAAMTGKAGRGAAVSKAYRLAGLMKEETWRR